MDGERRSIPTLLVESVARDFESLDSIRCARKQGASLVDVGETVVMRADKAAELGLEFDPSESTPADYAGQAYSSARDDAEETGGGRYIFTGLSNTGKNSAEVIWTRSFKVGPDDDGAVLAEDEAPTAQILSSAAATVERFGALATGAVAQLLEQQKTTMEGLMHLRTQIMEQAAIMRDLDTQRRLAGQEILEHEERMKKMEMLGGTLAKGFEMLAPQLAEVVAAKKREAKAKAEPEPDTTPPESASTKGEPTPCQEAGELSRALTRSPEHLEKFKAQFTPGQWAHFERAMKAPTRDELDACVRGLLLECGFTTRAEAQAGAQQWLGAVHHDEVMRVMTLAGAAVSRLTFPLSPKDAGGGQGDGQKTGP